MIKSLSYAYAHRRERKAICGVSGFPGQCRQPFTGHDLRRIYQRFEKSGVVVNRKLMADMAVKEPEAFVQLVTIAKKSV